MTGPVPRRSEIFQRVLETPQAGRSAVLDQLCASDIDLRREIEELVAAVERALSTASMRAGVLPELQTLAPGSRIGPYEVEDELARGGMSIIYRARDVTLGRPAVLKSSRFSRNPRFRARLEQEARLAARLSGHPNIAVIYGLVHDDGDIYIAQELVEGITLRQALTAGPLSETETFEAALAIASAMSAAHEAGVVHRDLKPENIMRVPSGAYKVLDFGIAKADAAALETSLESGLTLPGEALGTPGYASPEQLLGRPVDKRADVFAFGIVLYEMLTGRHPFGEAPRFAAALEDPKPLVTDGERTIASGLAAVVDRCLQRSPAHRYESGAALEAALREVRDAPGAQAAPQRPRRDAIWWWRFHLFTATAAHALIVLALWHVRAWWPQWRLAPGTPDLALVAVFFVPLALVCLTGVMRFNLAFTLSQHPDRVEAQYRGIRRPLGAADAVFAGLTALGGLLIAANHPSWSTLLIACGASVATVAFVTEPSTAEAALARLRRRETVRE